MILNANIFKMIFYWICYGTHIKMTQFTDKSLLLICSVLSQKNICCDEWSLTNTRSLTDFNIHSPCQKQVHIHLFFRYRFLLPGKKKGITTMLPLPNVFFSISDFTFLCSACYEYFAVISLIMFHLRYCLVVTIFAVIL